MRTAIPTGQFSFVTMVVTVRSVANYFRQLLVSATERESFIIYSEQNYLKRKQTYIKEDTKHDAQVRKTE